MGEVEGWLLLASAWWHSKRIPYGVEKIPDFFHVAFD
jgi:hypothetical protein